MCLICNICEDVFFCSSARIHRRLDDINKFSIVKCEFEMIEINCGCVNNES